MIIHVVRAGDTIESIANQYGISSIRLIQDNGLDPKESLVLGQTIVIVHPEQVYIVKEGDTLTGIAAENGITLLQLIQNNPFLSVRDYIYPGEELVIRYNDKNGEMIINGFANSYLHKEVLTKTLPFLTYLTIWENYITENAEIISVEDGDILEIIQLSKDYGVAPMMLITAFTPKGELSQETAYKIVYTEEYQDIFINNVINVLNQKGYYGVNIAYHFLSAENIQAYNVFNKKFSDAVRNAGFSFFVTIPPRLNQANNKMTYEQLDYSQMGQQSDQVLFMSYYLGYSFAPPLPVISVSATKEILEYAVTIIPPEKLSIGISVIGYDWKLPFVPGVTKANALSNTSAINLAGEVGAEIQFDEESQTPFYNYSEVVLPIDHIVWFTDARSINEMSELVPTYGLKGVGIWNIMYYNAQLWLIINSQYDILKIR
jgi:Predicted glycosyl hydrolase